MNLEILSFNLPVKSSEGNGNRHEGFLLDQ